MLSPATFNAIRYSIATVWFITGLVVLWIYPIADSLALVNRTGLGGDLAYIAVYTGGILDIAMGICTLILPSKKLWVFQFTITIAYTACIAIFLPEYLIHPFGPILKNIPFLTMLYLLYQHTEKTP